LGEDGLFKTAKYAVTKTEEETAREKLEVALADLQARKYTDESYDETDYINKYLEDRQMKVIEDVVEVDGWKFEIDRSVPKIGQNIGQEELKRITIEVPYIGTASFTTKVQYVYKEEEVQEYIYKIDGEEVKTIEEKEYTTEDEIIILEPESTHTVQVIAKYKNGTQIESKVVTFKTKPRTYLYNNGDTCDAITGGWKAEAIGCGNSATVVEPYIDTNKDGSIYAYMTSPSKYYGGSILVNNKIDYASYRKICFRITASVGYYLSDTVIDLWMNHENPIYIARICGGGNGSLDNQVVKYNINQLENIEDIYIYIQAHARRGGSYCNIYEAWLEK